MQEKNIKRQALQNRIEILEMDATDMKSHREEFDMAINFTGLEDIHMTRGKTGVQQTFLEVNRILKPKSYFCFVLMPPDEMENKAQKIEVELFSYICSATYLSSKEYRAILEKAKFKLISRRGYYSGMKFTPEQAKSEIRYTIKNCSKIYRINTPTFKEVWAKFGQAIEENGLGCYSKVVLIIAQKVGDV